jgi:hypothetical protein
VAEITPDNVFRSALAAFTLIILFSKVLTFSKMFVTQRAFGCVKENGESFLGIFPLLA